MKLLGFALILAFFSTVLCNCCTSFDFEAHSIVKVLDHDNETSPVDSNSESPYASLSCDSNCRSLVNSVYHSPFSELVSSSFLVFPAYVPTFSFVVISPQIQPPIAV